MSAIRRRGRFVANADREQGSMMRTEMLAWLLHLHGRRLRQEPPPRRGAEGLQQIGRFEHSLIKRNRKFVDSPLEGSGFELPVPREIAEACRRHEQTVGRWTRHLAPWRSSESDGPSVAPTSSTDLPPLPASPGLSQHRANEWAQSMATYGANGFSNALKPSSPLQPFGPSGRGGSRKR
jgi:hypothetical protein